MNVEHGNHQNKNHHFADGEEFSLIESLFGRDHFSRSAEGLGDDGFVLRQEGESLLVVSTDTSIEGIHFRLDRVTPEQALEKAIISNLSDINAMGGMTRQVFFNLGALKKWNHVQWKSLRETLAHLEKRYGFTVCGGDTVRKDTECFFTFTVMGIIEGEPLLRSNARPGHRIYVSGRIGSSAAGLFLLETDRGGDSHYADFVRAHNFPSPPLNLGPALARLGNSVAAIDISDGLSSELWHLSRQSACRLVIDVDRLPFDGRLGELAAEDIRMRWVLHGGEDYQLLFTGNFQGEELRKLEDVSELSEIGYVEEGEGVYISNNAGDMCLLEAAGWSH